MTAVASSLVRGGRGVTKPITAMQQRVSLTAAFVITCSKYSQASSAEMLESLASFYKRETSKMKILPW